MIDFLIRITFITGMGMLYVMLKRKVARKAPHRRELRGTKGLPRTTE
jgi:hypothetical protein